MEDSDTAASDVLAGSSSMCLEISDEDELMRAAEIFLDDDEISPSVQPSASTNDVDQFVADAPTATGSESQTMMHPDWPAGTVVRLVGLRNTMYNHHIGASSATRKSGC
jgi:hypothetical protein